MKTVFLVSFINFWVAVLSFADPFTFTKEPLDGRYVYPLPRNYVMRELRLEKGRFTDVWSSDDLSPPAKPPLEKDKESGRFSLDGSRVVLLGDNPAVAQVLFHCTIDGVSVLLDHIALIELHDDQPIDRSECFILKRNSDEDYFKWWKTLSTEHPNLVKWVRPDRP
jgi:hypothetical protein